MENKLLAKPRLSKRRFFSTLVISSLVLILLIGILVSHIYGKLQAAVFAEYSSKARDTASRIKEKLGAMTLSEEERPFDGYNFFSDADKAVETKSGAPLSPLSRIPPQTAVPGIVGFFQINPDGVFQTPLLPVLAHGEVEMYRYALGDEEYTRRTELVTRLRNILSNNKLLTAAGEALFPEQQQTTEASAEQIQSLELDDSLLNSQALNAPEASTPTVEAIAKNEAFERKTEPFQALSVSDGQIVFFRTVVSVKKLYLQGFIVDREPFFKKLVQEPFRESEASVRSGLIISYKGAVLRRFDSDVEDESESLAKSIVLYRTTLPRPLEDFELYFLTRSLPLGDVLKYGAR